MIQAAYYDMMQTCGIIIVELTAALLQLNTKLWELMVIKEMAYPIHSSLPL